ncbi:MAG: ion channel [Candidatus Binataceae bacterium]
MANPEHLAKLKEGVEAWNKWRKENPEIDPELDDADLQGADLSVANLQGANLADAYVSSVRYLGPQFRLRAAFARAWNWLRNDPIPYRRRLKHIRLWFRAANARCWNWLRSRNWLRRNPIPYRRRVMVGRYQGIRGLSSCYGNRIFVRDAADQDYLDTLEESLESRLGKFFFWVWGLFDYGRSLMSVVAFASTLIFGFGWIYSHWPEMLSSGGRPRTPFTPYYFSIVTYTTLGFGDVRPTTLGGEILTSIEVILGYVTLGLMLAVLGDRIARRS